MNLAVLAGQAGSQNAGGSIMTMVILYAVIIGIFWFFAIRPQSKQKKEHENLLSTLEVGDSILTTSGFFGVVIDIKDEIVIVEFGSNKNCRIPMKKDNIVEIDKHRKFWQAYQSDAEFCHRQMVHPGTGSTSAI